MTDLFVRTRALASAALWRLARGLRARDTLVPTAAGALLLWPFAGAPTAPLLAATLLAWLLPSLHALWAIGAGLPNPTVQDGAPDGDRPLRGAQRAADLTPPRIGGPGGRT